jgi:hypothetical protein
MAGRRALVALLAGAAWCTVSLTACGSSFSAGSQPGGPDGSSADGGVDVVDGSTVDGTLGDAMPSADGPAPGDGPGLDAPPATYGDITNPSAWQTFGPPAVADGGVHGGGDTYFGGAFDGRYVYYVPIEYIGDTTFSGRVVRYDTQANFLTSTAWSAFDLATVNPDAIGFVGAVFDGHYVYFVPAFRDHNGDYSGLVARYDTTASFASAASFDVFDATAVNASADGFGGGAFVGQYVYFAPYVGQGGNGHMATRYDTTASFDTATSWAAFDLTTASATAGGYLGAVFDGRYVYYVPNGSGLSGLVARFDTKASFGSPAGWTFFDMTTVHGLAKGFAGGVFDGRYVYFVPHFTNQAGGNPGAYSGRVGRYDTQGPFAMASSWSTFDVSTVNALAVGFIGGVFDGRYVYLVPAGPGGIQMVTARFDTTAAFTSSSSWSMFEMTQITSAPGFQGGAFDGEYVYLMGGDPTTPAIRFDAKTPPSMPPSYKGSFF